MTRIRGLDPQRCLVIPVDVGKSIAMALVTDHYGEIIIAPFEFSLTETGFEVLSAAISHAGLDPGLWTRDLWLCGFGQPSGYVGLFVGGGTEVAAVGVATFGVVAGQPAEHLAATGSGVIPVAVVLKDLAFEGSVE